MSERKQRYVRQRGKIRNWHYERDCSLIKRAELVPLEERDLPDTAGPCTHCADGLRATDLRKRADSA